MGAAGIQGDTKTILALGGYAMSVASVITIQEAQGIVFTKSIEPYLVAQQVRAVLKNNNVDAIKVGLLENEAMVNALADVFEEFKNSDIDIIVDPSIISRSGKILVDEHAIAAWKRRLYVCTKVLTPNLKEAELLGSMKINDIDDMRHATDMMRTLGVENVVLKAGQAESDKELYFVATPNEERIYERHTVDTNHTLGAGSAFSSALAVSLAQKMDIFRATEHALDFLHQAISTSDGFGYAHGPINHAFEIEKHAESFHPEEIKVYKL
jgi:hydroxymethylpyrimidine/phosphomethylpyrimidine kinase